MSPPYRFHATRYACPDCASATEGAAGPDHIVVVRCLECDWSRAFDPAADEFASRELERIDREVKAETDQEVGR